MSTYAVRMAVCLGAIVIAPVAAHANARGDLGRQTAARSAGTSCSCVTITVPVPEALRNAARVSFEVRLNGQTGVIGRLSGEVVLDESSHLLLTLRVPAEPRIGVLDVADILFRTASGSEFVVPILFRVSAYYGFLSETARDEAAHRAVAVAVASPTRVWSAGVESGIGRAGLAGSTAGFDEARTAFAAAVFVDRAMASRWSVRTGLGFVQRGGASRVTGSSASVAMSYFEVPLLARYRLPMVRDIVPVVFAGPSVALQVTCTLKLSGSGFRSSEPCDDGSGTSKPQSTDAGLIFGVGAEAPVGPVSVELSGRHTSGWVSIGAPIDVRNSGWTFTVGAAIPMSALFRRAPEA